MAVGIKEVIAVEEAEMVAAAEVVVAEMVAAEMEIGVVQTLGNNYINRWWI